MIQNNSLLDLQLGRFQVNRRKDLNLPSKLEDAYSRHRTRWQGKVSGREERITSAWPSLQPSQPVSLLSLVSSTSKMQLSTPVHYHPKHTGKQQVSYFDSKNQTKGGLGLSPAVPTVLLYLLQHSRHLPWRAAGLTSTEQGRVTFPRTIFSGALEKKKK